ncbi:retrovirus-related pol polyprotein from transposon TNT 1-94 [Tanacetum coccineum]
MGKEKSVENDEVFDKNVTGLSELDMVQPIKLVNKKEGIRDGTDDESDESANEELTGWETKAEAVVKTPRSRHIGYYLKHEINKKLIKGLVDNQKYNYSLLATRLRKMDYETYNSLSTGPMYNAILKKNLAKKEDMGGNFVIPCNIGGLKYMDALVDQGSDVNVMPLSTYNRLTNEKPVGADIRLSLASHSYIYPIGIAEDVLAEIAGYVYPIDFVVLDIKEDKKKPFILGTPFLTMAKAEIRFDKGTVI